MLGRSQNQSKTRPDASLRRTLLVAGFIAVWMLAIGVRLVYLQVSQRDKLTERAHKQQQGAIETSPERGQLIDREGRSLARSVQTGSIFVAPDELDDVECTANLLAKALEVDKANLATQLFEAKSAARRFV